MCLATLQEDFFDQQSEMISSQLGMMIDVQSD